MKRVLIPSTFTADEKNRFLRDYKIGMIARACATFGVNEVIVYFDKDPMVESHGLGKHIITVLKYLRTPPYLRKYLFPLERELSTVGVVHPVIMPSHAPEFFGLRVREGYAVSDGLVDLGFNKKSRVSGARKGSVVTVNLDNMSIVKPRDYMGYDCSYFNKPLNKLMDSIDGVMIGTSKYGSNIKSVKLPVNNYNLIFGSAYRGLKELGVLNKCNLVINAVPIN